MQNRRSWWRTGGQLLPMPWAMMAGMPERRNAGTTIIINDRLIQEYEYKTSRLEHVMSWAWIAPFVSMGCSMSWLLAERCRVTRPKVPTILELGSSKSILMESTEIML